MNYHLKTYGWLKGFGGYVYLTVGILVLLAMPVSAEVLDKMPPVNHMIATMVLAASVSAISIYFSFRFRRGLGVGIALLAWYLNYNLPDSDSLIRTAVLRETGSLFAWIFYGRWLLFFAGFVGVLKSFVHGRRESATK